MRHSVVSARSLRLDLAIRLRTIGLWPWLVFVGWGLVARAQEPTMLRSFGIEIAGMALWSGAAILLLALALVEPGPRPPRLLRDVITSSALVALLGLAQAVLAAVLDAAFLGVPRLTDGLRSSCRFGFVWLPAVIPLVSAVPGAGPATRLAQFVPAVVSLCVAGPIWRLDLATGGFVAALASAGSLLAAAALQVPGRGVRNAVGAASESPRQP